MCIAVAKHRQKYRLDNSTVGRTSNSTKRQSAHGLCFALAAIFALFLLAVPTAHARRETVLYSFGSQPGDGGDPNLAGVIMDSQGNLYGTTLYGGLSGCDGQGCGTVFKVTPTRQETVLYSFGSQSGDGYWPNGGLVMDNQGNLYGTTLQGGDPSCQEGCGTVFKVSPSGQETVIHTFSSQTGDGYWPFSGLIMDKQGNLYGTTMSGGANGEGTVFKLTPSGTEAVLYSFGSQYPDGNGPRTDLVMDKDGNLYGTNFGGTNNCGTVFKVTPSGEETVLYNFGKAGDGCAYEAGLTIDKKGNLYGTTPDGGEYGVGTVFKVTPSGEETVIYSFGGHAGDGESPSAGLIISDEGNLYGTTESGGWSHYYGTVFEITHAGAGEENVIYSFTGGTDGSQPCAGLIMDARRALYGTTSEGGNNRIGTVFKIAP